MFLGELSLDGRLRHTQGILPMVATARTAGLKQVYVPAEDVALAARLQSFRAEHDLSQAEVAAAVGAGNKSAVTDWENAVSVPSGLRKRRLIELLEGKRWKVLREVVMVGEGMPQCWHRAARWYRRASREVANRRTVGEVILATLADVRELSTVTELRDHYRERAGGWPANPTTPLPVGSTVRLAEDAAYGLRWIEILSGTTLDPRRSCSGQSALKLGPRGGRARARQTGYAQSRPVLMSPRDPLVRMPHAVRIAYVHCSQCGALRSPVSDLFGMAERAPGPRPSSSSERYLVVPAENLETRRDRGASLEASLRRIGLAQRPSSGNLRAAQRAGRVLTPRPRQIGPALVDVSSSSLAPAPTTRPVRRVVVFMDRGDDEPNGIASGQVIDVPTTTTPDQMPPCQGAAKAAGWAPLVDSPEVRAHR